MFQDSLREIEKIASFLGLQAFHDLCKAIANKCQFDNLEKDKNGFETEF